MGAGDRRIHRLPAKTSILALSHVLWSLLALGMGEWCLRLLTPYPLTQAGLTPSCESMGPGTGVRDIPAPSEGAERIISGYMQRGAGGDFQLLFSKQHHFSPTKADISYSAVDTHGYGCFYLWRW